MGVEIAILHRMLSKEIDEISDFLKREQEEDREMNKARESNYHLLRLVLEQPNLSPVEYTNILHNKYGPGRSLDVHNQLRTNSLYSIERRQRLGRIMKDITGSLYSLLTGSSSNYLKDFDEIARFVRARDFRERRVEGKVFLIGLISLPSWEQSEQYSSLRTTLEILESVSTKGSYKLCRETVRRIVDLVGTEYGLERRKTSTERVQDILEDITVSRDLEDMRATFLIMQKESEHLKEQFEEEVRNHNQEFIHGFFARMNSVRTGELLDSIAQTDFLIQKLQKQGWKLEPELQAIPTIIQLFENFLRLEGVVPAEPIGEVRTLNGTQLSEYEFVGGSKPRIDEKVNVVIRTPGWRYGTITIAKPRVEEIVA